MVSPLGSAPALRDAKAAMTPENIKPLLENAKEILGRPNDFIVEIQVLIRQHAPPLGGAAKTIHLHKNFALFFFFYSRSCLDCLFVLDTFS